MIRPRLSKVTNGTRLTTDLVNGIINRTEYAADLLRQYKLIAGNEMYIEPHYDGTRVSYLSPVGSGSNLNPVVRPNYKYRVIQNTASLNLVVGGPSSVNAAVRLQRYTGTGVVGDPIVPKSWVTPIGYKAKFFVPFFPFVNTAVADVTGEFVNINHIFNILAVTNEGHKQILVYLVDEKDFIIAGSFLSDYVFYPYNPTITITSSSLPLGSASRLSLSYNIGPLVDFSPVQVTVKMYYNNVDTFESFNIFANSFFNSGSFVSDSTFDVSSGSPLFFTLSTYFKGVNGLVYPS